MSAAVREVSACQSKVQRIETFSLLRFDCVQSTECLCTVHSSCKPYDTVQTIVQRRECGRATSVVIVTVEARVCVTAGSCNLFFSTLCIFCAACTRLCPRAAGAGQTQPAAAFTQRIVAAHTRTAAHTVLRCHTISDGTLQPLPACTVQHHWVGPSQGTHAHSTHTHAHAPLPVTHSAGLRHFQSSPVPSSHHEIAFLPHQFSVLVCGCELRATRDSATQTRSE